MIDKTYYNTMLEKGRLMPFIAGDRLGAFITFYICNKGEENKYLRDNMWSVEEDNPNGNCCYIDQFWSDNNLANPKMSYRAWKGFKRYIKNTFRNVECIVWKRWNKKSNKLTKWEFKIRS